MANMMAVYQHSDSRHNHNNQNFIIGEESDAINKAKASSFSTDILGVDRNTNPDIGAYQHIIFEVEEEE